MAEAPEATDAHKASHKTTSPRGPSDGDALLDLKILVIVVKNVTNENMITEYARKLEAKLETKRRASISSGHKYANATAEGARDTFPLARRVLASW